MLIFPSIPDFECENTSFVYYIIRLARFSRHSLCDWPSWYLQMATRLVGFSYSLCERGWNCAFIDSTQAKNPLQVSFKLFIACNNTRRIVPLLCVFFIVCVEDPLENVSFKLLTFSRMIWQRVTGIDRGCFAYYPIFAIAVQMPWCLCYILTVPLAISIAICCFVFLISIRMCNLFVVLKFPSYSSCE